MTLCAISLADFTGDLAVATILFFESRIVVTSFSGATFFSFTKVVVMLTVELVAETAGVVINTPHGSTWDGIVHINQT